MTTLYWNPPVPDARFEPTTPPDRRPIPDAPGRMDITGPFDFPGDRKQLVQSAAGKMKKLYRNGDVLLPVWGIRPGGQVSAMPHKIQPGHVVNTLAALAYGRNLPEEIEGCSVEYLRQGMIWASTTQRFGDAVYSILRFGGAYGREGIGPGPAYRTTEKFMDALLAEAAQTHVHIFELDLGFSSWFYRIAWDAAFAVVNAQEWYLALFLATDTD